MSIFSMYFLIGFFSGIGIALCAVDIICGIFPEHTLRWAIAKFKNKKNDVIIFKDLK